MTITQQIRNLLNFSPEARNSDKELYILYLQRTGMELTPKQIALIKDMPSFESIRRIRQKLQEKGEFLPREGVARQRRLKSYAVQQNVPNAPPERVEQILEDGSKALVPAEYRIVE